MRFSAPTGGEIDMSLSFRITSRSAGHLAVMRRPGIVHGLEGHAGRSWRRRRSLATALAVLALDLARPWAMPSAAEIEVDEWPVPKVS
jgi:hypothetical protein